MPKQLLQPTVEDLGVILTHDMPCCVHGDEPAVLNCNTGIFAPSWRAQKEGYMLVKPPRWLRPLLGRYKA